MCLCRAERGCSRRPCGSLSDRSRIAVGSLSDRCRIVVSFVCGVGRSSSFVPARRLPLFRVFCDCADRYAASIVTPYRLFRSYRSLHPSGSLRRADRGGGEGSYVARGVRVHTSFVDRADRIDRPIGSLVVLSSPISSFTSVSRIGVCC